MLRLLLVALGGGLGASARYGVSLWTAKRDAEGSFIPASFPLATFLVNLIGCFAIGFVVVWLESRGESETNLRYFLIAGLLGGFTTFSAFGSETFALLRTGSHGLACANAFGQLALGVLGVWLGATLARSVGGA